MELEGLVLRLKKTVKRKLFTLRHRKLLRDFNIDEPIFSADQFPEYRPNLWLDLPDAGAQIERKVVSGEITDEEGRQLRHFSANGYMILKGALSHEKVDRANAELIKAVREGRIEGVIDTPESLEKSRALDLHEKIPMLRELFENPEVLRWMRLIFGRRVVPFQSLNFFYGSQQEAHSDAIHMTTYPLGYMAASWTALEDVDADSGPLLYYPGSHRLPYIFSHECGIEREEYVLEGRDAYSQKYEVFVKDRMARENFKKEFFLPQKGDVLIWHHNLIHGGSKRNSPTKSRKSFVCHYFAEGVLCYHDLIGEYAKIKELPR